MLGEMGVWVGLKWKECKGERERDGNPRIYSWLVSRSGEEDTGIKKIDCIISLPILSAVVQKNKTDKVVKTNTNNQWSPWVRKILALTENSQWLISLIKAQRSIYNVHLNELRRARYDSRQAVGSWSCSPWSVGRRRGRVTHLRRKVSVSDSR